MFVYSMCCCGVSIVVMKCVFLSGLMCIVRLMLELSCVFCRLIMLLVSMRLICSVG